MTQLYMFKKSGAVVEIMPDIDPFTGKPIVIQYESPGPALCSVRCIDTGKKLLVPRHALIPLKQIDVCHGCHHHIEHDGCIHDVKIWVTDDKYETEVHVRRAYDSQK
jgi:hypothetical protein